MSSNGHEKPLHPDRVINVFYLKYINNFLFSDLFIFPHGVEIFIWCVVGMLKLLVSRNIFQITFCKCVHVCRWRWSWMQRWGAFLTSHIGFGKSQPVYREDPSVLYMLCNVGIKHTQSTTPEAKHNTEPHQIASHNTKRHTTLHKVTLLHSTTQPMSLSNKDIVPHFYKQEENRLTQGSVFAM